MSKIYTKTGDTGMTSLLGGKRVKKSCLEIEAIGDVDELNALIGIQIAELEDDIFEDVKKKLASVQHVLFHVGSNLAAAQTDLIAVPKVTSDHVQFLENWIDELQDELPILTQFILPAGHIAAGQSFFARAICRRAERGVITMSDQYAIDVHILKYLNRLSDLLFVLGRWINAKNSIQDVAWEK